MNFQSAWDAQIFHTWNSTTWRMPGAFWMQRIQFNGFSMEIFNIDSNAYDAKPLGEDEKHNICQDWGPQPGIDCGNIDMNLHTCRDRLNHLLDEGVKMIKERLEEEKATWTFVNTHFHTLITHWGPEELKGLREKGLIDFVFVGHAHIQETMTGWGGVDNAWNHVISGGGGGVTSDNCPKYGGWDEAYGYVYFTATKDQLVWEMRGHGGFTGEVQIQKRCTVEKGMEGNNSKPV